MKNYLVPGTQKYLPGNLNTQHINTQHSTRMLVPVYTASLWLSVLRNTDKITVHKSTRYRG